MIESIDYVWLGASQPLHLRHAERRRCAFEFETPYQEGDYPWFHPALLWESVLTMAAMPRKVSFYLITDTTGSPSTCIIFLETVARTEPGVDKPKSLHLSSRTGTTVVWQQKPTVVRGMYFTYFLFDSFGCLQPEPWDSQVYTSSLGKRDNNAKLALDGRWALCSFFRALNALGEFNLVGWDQRLTQLSEVAMKNSHQRLARTFHQHLDDIYFHQEKFALMIRLAKVVMDGSADFFEGGPAMLEFFDDFVRDTDYSLQRYSRFERKITNSIQMVCTRQPPFYPFCTPWRKRCCYSTVIIPILSID